MAAFKSFEGYSSRLNTLATILVIRDYYKPELEKFRKLCLDWIGMIANTKQAKEVYLFLCRYDPRSDVTLIAYRRWLDLCTTELPTVQLVRTACLCAHEGHRHLGQEKFMSLFPLVANFREAMEESFRTHPS